MMLVIGCVAAVSPGWAAVPDLTHFDIEDLMQIKVVSATKVEQALEDTASAVLSSPRTIFAAVALLTSRMHCG